MSSRRSFLRDTVSAGALALMPNAARAIDPIRRASGPRMKLSLAAYSFRDYLAGKNKSMTYEEFVELAAGYDLDAIEPTSYYFPEGVTPDICAGSAGERFCLDWTSPEPRSGTTSPILPGRNSTRKSPTQGSGSTMRSPSGLP